MAQKFKPIRVLFISPVSFIGGAEKSLLDILNTMDRKRIRPQVMVPSEGPLLDALRSINIDVRIVKWPESVQGYSKNQAPLHLKMIWDFLRFGFEISTAGLADWDVIYTNGLKAHLLGFYVKLLAHKKLIWHFRDDLSHSSWRYFFSGMSGWVDKIICNSRATARIFPSGARTTVAYSAVDIQKSPLSRAAICKKLRIDPHSLIISTIKHLAPNLGQEYFLRAAKLIQAVLPQAVFLIAGESIYAGQTDYKQYLKNLARQLGLLEQVHFLGFYAKVNELYKISDLIVMPSFEESFGRTALEAFRLGAPVVSTRVGGVPEIISQGENGLLVEPGNPVVMAQACLQILQTPRLRASLIENGKKRARDFSLKKIVRHIEAEIAVVCAQ